MSLLEWLRESLGQKLSALHKGEGGAVAIMILAALLIVFMISLVIYDTGKIARDKLEVQAAAETAAWSHSAVEARTMNTIAFANIGKKIIVGMNAYYEALLIAYVALAVIIALLIIACAIAAIFAGDVCLSDAIEAGVDIVDIFAGEADDISKFYGNTMKNYFKDDAKALDDYQTYMAEITPWWAWMEGYLRGARNGATAVGTFPVPKNLASNLPSLPGGLAPSSTGLVDKLPVKRASNNEQLCSRLWSEGDLILHFIDYIYKSMIEPGHTGDQWKMVIIPLAGLMAIPITNNPTKFDTCRQSMSGRFGEQGRPFQIDFHGKPQSAVWWQLYASNLVFAYRPNSALKGVDKSKYNFLSRNYQRSMISNANLSKDATGSWAMARSEISFQDEGKAPDLWHTNWSSRMRPVALGTEWQTLSNSDSKIKLSGAAIDALPFLAAGSLIGGITSSAGGGGSSGSFGDVLQDMMHDGARLIMATDAMSGDKSKGLGR